MTWLPLDKSMLVCYSSFCKYDERGLIVIFYSKGIQTPKEHIVSFQKLLSHLGTEVPLTFSETRPPWSKCHVDEFWTRIRSGKTWEVHGSGGDFKPWYPAKFSLRTSLTEVLLHRLVSWVLMILNAQLSWETGLQRGWQCDSEVTLRCVYILPR